MAWVIGIKQVTLFQPERDGKQAIPKPVRVVSSLLPQAIERTLQRPVILPESTGAGPCGTLARRRWSPTAMPSRLFEPGVAFHGSILNASPLAWSVEHLVEPLRAYYAAYEPPRRFGAKDTPRGRRFACTED